jgi:DNA-binding MarR family transcriptional regulator
METAALHDIIIQFTRIMNKFNELEKEPVDFGTGEKLFPSEIHTVQAIGAKPGITTTEISSMFGITKGAVSQVTAKLHRRGYLHKERNREYGKEIFLTLTEKGGIAYRNHELFHKKMAADISKFADSFPPKDIQQFSRILEQLEVQIEALSAAVKQA